MEDVLKWLKSDKDYKEGARLYNLYGKNARLKMLFLKTESTYNREKLFSELKNLVRDYKPKKEEEVLNVVHAMERGEINPYNFPVISSSEASALDDLWTLYNALETERNKLSNQYHALRNAKAPKEEFARHYKKIEEKSAEMLQVWDRINNNRGTMAEDDLENLKQEKKRVIDKRSKIKKKLENYIKYPEGCAKRVEMEREVAVLSAKYQTIMQNLKGK
jgi:hypothetical protein